MRHNAALYRNIIMTNQRFEVNIPFSGFYESWHSNQFDDEIDQTIENWTETLDCDMPQKLQNMFYDAANYGNARLEYAKAYLSAFADEYLNGDLQFTIMTSPREYNFETDRLFGTISRKTLAMIIRKTDPTILTRIAKKNHTSRSGFISFYEPDWRSWGRVTTWEHNQLGTLLQAYLETERNESWDMWAEYELCEDFSGSGHIHSWLWHGEESNRAWAIYNYCTHYRPNRPIKTMAEFWAARQKPWDTTPLGSI